MDAAEQLSATPVFLILLKFKLLSKSVQLSSVSASKSLSLDVGVPH